MHINKAGLNEQPSRITERPDPPAPSSRPRQGVKDLVDVLAPFAGLANEHDLTALEDADTLEVLVRDVKRAAVVYARATGGGEDQITTLKEKLAKPRSMTIEKWEG